MDFRQLESFLMISRLKSFSRAAEELFLTQPTISNHIRTLENELGVTLFKRTSWDVSLTEEGKVFIKEVEKILKQKKNVMAQLYEMTDHYKGTLKIYASTIPEQYVLPQLIKGFNKEFPDVQILIRHSDSSNILCKMKEKEIEFGFSGGTEFSNDFEVEEILQDDLILVSDVSEERNEITEEDLTNIPMIIREEGSGHREVLDKYLKKKKLNISKINVVAVADSTETIKKLILNGVGMSFISRIAVKDYINRGLLKEIKLSNCQLVRSFYFVKQKNSKLQGINKIFVEYVSSYLDK